TIAVVELELRREVLQCASSKDAQPFAGHGCLNIRARKPTNIVVSPCLDLTSYRIATMVKVNAADVAVLERKANSISPTVAHLRNCLLVCSPCRRIDSRRIATWVINTPWRLRPLLSVPEPAPAQPHFLGAQMRERRRQLGDVAVIGLWLQRNAISHGGRVCIRG